MKKILFISPRNPFSGRFSGDVIRAKEFALFFSKKLKTTIVTLDRINSNKKIGKINLITFKEKNLIYKFFYIIIALIKLKPLQLGFFYSKQIKNFVENNYKNYDIIFCQSLRAAQYATDISVKKKILDMGDLYSRNYSQACTKKSVFNPIKFVYFIESILISKYEKFCLKNFDKTLLFSKKEINSLGSLGKNNVMQINFGINHIVKKFKFSKKNNKIIFVGNIKYSPNRIACKNFINKILPKILKIDSNIKFHIIGEISKLDKFIWERSKSIKVHGKVNNLKPLLSQTFCGIANLNVSSGVQTKLLTYMSYGIPSISSLQVIKNFDVIKSNFLPSYKNEKEFINLIFKLKYNKKYSVYVSNKSLNLIKNFKWGNVLKVFNKILN